jgi:MoaA/NifB/PqqE/SkfB family radical SAM enzyme
MSLDEWRRVFGKLGRTPFYMTFTGGEPYLRSDFADLVIAAYVTCRPAVVTIPTNGLLTDRIVAETDRICAACADSQIGLNLSLDGLGEEHDRMRGVPGNWAKAQRTWALLRELQRRHAHLVLSVHTVISKFNIDRFYDIQEGLRKLQPDSYITEVAEERVELDTVGWQITPSAESYGPVADFLSGQARQSGARGLALVTQAFRAQYYQLAKQILHEQRQVIPCYAGWASGHIAPDGDVWGCCVRAEPVGNLRETGYELTPIWQGEKMAGLRRSVAAGECACPMANASYANMLLHVPTLAKVAAKVLSGSK